MPINEQQPEQPAPAPSVTGLAWSASGDEPSGAGQSRYGNTTERSRAGQSQSQRFPGNGPVSNRHDLPDGYLDVSGGWTPDAAPSLMDLLVAELIPQPSQEALDLVAWDPTHRWSAPLKLLVASAITMLQQADERNEARSAAFVIDELKDACHRGVMSLQAAKWHNSGRPIADSIPIVRRPNEAPRFA